MNLIDRPLYEFIKIIDHNDILNEDRGKLLVKLDSYKIEKSGLKILNNILEHHILDYMEVYDSSGKCIIKIKPDFRLDLYQFEIDRSPKILYKSALIKKLEEKLNDVGNFTIKISINKKELNQKVERKLYDLMNHLKEIRNDLKVNLWFNLSTLKRYIEKQRDNLENIFDLLPNNKLALFIFFKGDLKVGRYVIFLPITISNDDINLIKRLIDENFLNNNVLKIISSSVLTKNQQFYLNIGHFLSNKDYVIDYDIVAHLSPLFIYSFFVNFATKWIGSDLINEEKLTEEISSKWKKFYYMFENEKNIKELISITNLIFKHISWIFELNIYLDESIRKHSISFYFRIAKDIIHKLLSEESMISKEAFTRLYIKTLYTKLSEEYEKKITLSNSIMSQGLSLAIRTVTNISEMGKLLWDAGIAGVSLTVVRSIIPFLTSGKGNLLIVQILLTILSILIFIILGMRMYDIKSDFECLKDDIDNIMDYSVKTFGIIELSNFKETMMKELKTMRHFYGVFRKYILFLIFIFMITIVFIWGDQISLLISIMSQ